jgi:hypothetical protein
MKSYTIKLKDSTSEDIENCRDEFILAGIDITSEELIARLVEGQTLNDIRSYELGKIEK